MLVQLQNWAPCNTFTVQADGNSTGTGNPAGYCYKEQPAWSAYREPSFGHGTLDVINATTALWSVCLSATLGQSAYLSLWESLPVYHSGTVCACDRSDWPRVCLSVHLPVHICSLVVMGLLHVAYPEGSTCLIPTRQAQQAPPPSSIIKQGVICLSVCVQAVAQEPGQQPGDSRRSLHCAQPSPVPQQGQHLAHCHHRPGFHCRICPSSSRYYHCYPTCT